MNTKKAKEHCGYQEKPVLPVCSNCRNFTSDLVLPAWMIEHNAQVQTSEKDGIIYTTEKNGVEKNLRCKAHGFAVKKTATCGTWDREFPNEFKDQP